MTCTGKELLAYDSDMVKAAAEAASPQIISLAQIAEVVARIMQVVAFAPPQHALRNQQASKDYNPEANVVVMCRHRNYCLITSETRS